MHTFARLFAQTHVFAALLLANVLVCASGASAQVVLEMPAPPRKASAPASVNAPATVTTSTTTVVATAAPVPVSPPTLPTAMEPGDLALARYARARTGTRNTYFEDGSLWRGGVRWYSYPRTYTQYAWGPIGWPWIGPWSVRFVHGECK